MRELGIEPKNLKTETKTRIKEEVGLAIIEDINNYLDKSSTPVKGGSFQSKLSKEYKKKTGKSSSDLFLKGGMRSQIQHETYTRGVEVGVFDEDEAPKAYNHNVGDTLPQREFIPSDDNTFKKPITDKINAIIREIVNES